MEHKWCEVHPSQDSKTVMFARENKFPAEVICWPSTANTFKMQFKQMLQLFTWQDSSCSLHVLCVPGVVEWAAAVIKLLCSATASGWTYQMRSLEQLWRVSQPFGIGAFFQTGENTCLYSNYTNYCVG